MQSLTSATSKENFEMHSVIRLHVGFVWFKACFSNTIDQLLLSLLLILLRLLADTSWFNSEYLFFKSNKKVRIQRQLYLPYFLYFYKASHSSQAYPDILHDDECLLINNWYLRREIVENDSWRTFLINSKYHVVSPSPTIPQTQPLFAIK